MKQTKCPRYLSPQMREFWRRTCAEFDLEPDSALILQAACECWDRAQQARRLVEAEGLTLDNSKRRHPALDVEKQAYSLFLRAMRQLGLGEELTPEIGRPPGR